VGHLNQRLESELTSDGPDAVSYQLSQVGNDKMGEFLPFEQRPELIRKPNNSSRPSMMIPQLGD